MKSIPEMTEALRERFMGRLAKRLVVEALGPCLEMSGFADSDGYVRFSIKEEPFMAHRVAFAWLGMDAYRPELLVLHKCDNGRCCNPAHLFQGTHVDNMADMARKGRSPTLRGGSKSQAKCDDATMQNALDGVRLGVFTVREAAARLGITRAHFRRVLRGERWQHLQRSA